ncbi:hypothetical protein GCM10018771_67510 [Streptomyces cellulosae]|nr:hypothetical protein GCM10018771_67510 [Streptomyces cellulosae]
MTDEQNSGVRGGWLARFLERRREVRRARGPRRLSWEEAAERAAEDLCGVDRRDRPPARSRRLSREEAAERAADYLEGR